MIDTKKFSTLFKEATQAMFGKPYDECSKYEQYAALVGMMARTATQNRTLTEERIRKNGNKRVYYFSMEFLIGKLLDNYLYTVGIHEEAQKALEELGIDLQEMCDLEPEPGLEPADAGMELALGTVPAGAVRRDGLARKGSCRDETDPGDGR